MNPAPRSSRRTVLLTGGSRGLGAALVAAYARTGAAVVAVARHAGPLEATLAPLRAEGLDVHGIVADLGDKSAIHPLAARAAALVGPIDVLVHNASTLGPLPLRPLLDTECEDLDAVLQTNLVGPFRLSRILGGHMAVTGHGLIVHVSSDAAINGYPGWGAYGVSKAALDQLSRTFAAELAAHGVRVLSVDPGEMDTQMHADAVPDADRSVLARPEAVAARLLTLLDAQDTWQTGGRIELATLPARIGGAA